ncbi:competence type IV pilus minor pilin ComGG [Heyndrickxia sp. FSL W8-0423]|uniref:competence type IV pilus minor pilin ComGG n=1 Tax=Heyndrickxia sp. FSL W8-0423 TaxID=2921601 RepID=UPI0030FCB895
MKMNNEKGYIFPLTLGIVVTCLFVLTTSIEIFLSEKRYLKEMEEYYLVNSMSSMAVKKIVNSINKEDYLSAGKLSYNKGIVNFTIQEKEKNMYSIMLGINLDNHLSIKSEVIYNQQEKRILRWEEK